MEDQTQEQLVISINLILIHAMYGRYLYSDLYAGAVWTGIENPEATGNFTTSKIPFRCAHDSLIPCRFVAKSPVPELGYVFSFADDNKKDIYFLTSTGVYRVARPSHCNFTCPKEQLPLQGHILLPPNPKSYQGVAETLVSYIPFLFLFWMLSCKTITDND